MIIFVIIAALLIAFAAGVGEANRVVGAIHATEKGIHDRIAALEETIKGKL